MSLRESIPGNKERPEEWAKMLRGLESFLEENAPRLIVSHLLKTDPYRDNFAVIQEARFMCRWLAEALEKEEPEK